MDQDDQDQANDSGDQGGDQKIDNGSKCNFSIHFGIQTCCTCRKKKDFEKEHIFQRFFPFWKFSFEIIFGLHFMICKSYIESCYVNWNVFLIHNLEHLSQW